jgi:aminocarboxymuconate-semialdehyde decarboxylase
MRLGHDAPADEALERCRIQNGGLAALRAAHPDRVSVLGTVPLQDPEIAAGELEALIAGGSGVMERHPRLRVLLAHAGGAILALRGRLRHGWSALPVARSRLTEPPEASLRRFLYDTITHDAGLLRDLVAFAGADRVLLGSDHRFDMADARPADTVAAAGLAPEAERLVLGGNAARILGLEVHR